MATDLSSLFGGLFGDSFANMLGGTASLPRVQSTSQYLPLQDTLFNAFQNRQNIFAPSVKASGSYDASFSSPFGQEGDNGGLRWSYDPNWLTGIPHPAAAQQYNAPSLAETLTGGGGGHHHPDVHGGPAQDVIEWSPTDPLGNLQPPPMPAPLNPNGYWTWDQRGGGTGDPGVWKWVDGNVGPNPDRKNLRAF